MEQLSDLQKKLLPMLAWYHEFCVDNNLRYFIIGGTLLGAVRHGGFIPWDDDLDVGMPRDDYERFLELTKGNIYDKYVVEGIDTDKSDYFYGYTKVYDTSTTLVENTRYKIKRGIYIDIFPYDGIANDYAESKRIVKKIYKKHMILLLRTCGIRKGRKWYKNLSIKLARIIPNIDNKKLMMKIEELCKKNSYHDCKFVGDLYGGITEITTKEVIGEPRLYQFENLQVYGIERYDDYLTSLYGDWRQLPPKEKQVTQHDYIYCNLNTPYDKK